MARFHSIPRSALALTTLASASLAQGPTMEFSVVWEHTVLTEGVNKGAIYATIAPDIGSQIPWTTPPGTGQLGTLKAFAVAHLGFKGVQNGTTGVLSWTLQSEFMISNKPMTSEPGGGFYPYPAGQFGLPVNPNPNTKQTVKLYDLAWDPKGDYSPREVLWQTSTPPNPKVFLDVGLGAWVGQYATPIHAPPEGFWVVPAPTSAAGMLVLAGIGACRRRRS